MHRRFHTHIAAIALLPLLAGGCVQMTRHSNMMVFGTNTVVGLRVGTGGTNVPSIDVGFTRQEAVLLPLVANVGQDALHNRLVPCDPRTAIVDGRGNPVQYPVHPCSLVAIDAEGKARDSYSVLASFGGHFGASSENGKTTAQGGVAQYFATGMAAQLLALNGGAAVVSGGPAADSASGKAPLTLNGVQGTPAEIAGGVTENATYNGEIDKLLAAIAGTDDAKLVANLKAFETAIGASDIFVSRCNGTALAGAATIKANRTDYLGRFANARGAFIDAVKAWPTVK